MSFLDSLSQTPTPLNQTFFSGQNMNYLQNAIRQKVKDSTGYSIDKQNHDDLITIMRATFINNSTNGYGNVTEQVMWMNKVTIDTCVQQIYTGLSQYIGYVKEINKNPVPLDLPRNESTYGEFMNVNSRFGM